MTQKSKYMLQLTNYLGGFNFIPIGTVHMWEMFLIGFVH